jgi:hypothetical protein
MAWLFADITYLAEQLRVIQSIEPLIIKENDKAQHSNLTKQFRIVFESLRKLEAKALQLEYQTRLIEGDLYNPLFDVGPSSTNYYKSMFKVLCDTFQERQVIVNIVYTSLAFLFRAPGKDPSYEFWYPCWQNILLSESYLGKAWFVRLPDATSRRLEWVIHKSDIEISPPSKVWYKHMPMLNYILEFKRLYKTVLCLSFVLGQHPRIGERSPVKVLPDIVLKAIAFKLELTISDPTPKISRHYFYPPWQSNPNIKCGANSS